MDFAPLFADARRDLETWLAAGQLKSYVDVQEGFENIPKTFMRIFTGENIGKQMLKIAEPQLKLELEDSSAFQTSSSSASSARSMMNRKRADASLPISSLITRSVTI